jgi:hypothetical protein
VQHLGRLWFGMGLHVEPGGLKWACQISRIQANNEAHATRAVQFRPATLLPHEAMSSGATESGSMGSRAHGAVNFLLYFGPF